VVVLLDHLALLVAPVEAVLGPPVRACLEDLEPPDAEALEDGVDPGFAAVDGRREVEPELAILDDELLAVLLAAATGSRVDYAGDPRTARLDGSGVDARLSLAAIVLGVEVDVSVSRSCAAQIAAVRFQPTSKP
jgi:hypothetical protein